MPLNLHIAVVVPLVPMAIECAVVMLPTVFPDTVKFPAVPAVFIPLKVYPIAAVPVVSMEAMVLFCMLTVPVDLA